jgi:hypothetical protein
MAIGKGKWELLKEENGKRIGFRKFRMLISSI